MKVRIDIQIHLFKSIYRAMPSSDIRYYLNGVLCQYNGTELRLVATDGHRLNAIVHDQKDPFVEPMEFIIPEPMIKAIVKSKKSTVRIIDVEYDTDTKMISLSLPDGMIMRNMAVDGRFPDYARVIPKKISGEVACLDPQYVMDANDSLYDFLQKKKSEPLPKSIGYNGLKDAAVLSVPGFIAIVMPWRSDFNEYVETRLTNRFI